MNSEIYVFLYPARSIDAKIKIIKLRYFRVWEFILRYLCIYGN